MAAAGLQGVVELLCCPDKLVLPQTVRPHPEMDMAERFAQAIPAGSLQLATTAQTHGPLLAQACNPTPVAERLVLLLVEVR